VFFSNRFTVLIDSTPDDEDGEDIEYKILYLFYFILFVYLIEGLVNNTTFINWYGVRFITQFSAYIFLIIFKVDLYSVFFKDVNDTANFGLKIRIFRDDTVEIARTGIFINIDIIDNLNIVTRINTGSWEVGRTLNRV